MSKRDRSQTDGLVPSNPKVAKIREKENFALKIATRALVNEPNTNNFVCSPMSINVMMNLLAAGSEGSALDKWLHFLSAESVADLIAESNHLITLTASNKEEEEEEEHQGPRYLYGRIGGRAPALSFVNGAFTDESVTLKPSIKQLLETTYKAMTMSCDFQHKCNEAIGEINKWVEEATTGLIKEFVSRGIVDATTVLGLTNALFFNGCWEYPFDDTFTGPGTFYLVDGDTVNVDLMCSVGSGKYFLYGSVEGSKVLKVPYTYGKDDYRRFSMYFFLPDAKDGLPDLLQHVSSNPGFFSSELKLRGEIISKLVIPKFKFSYELNVNNAMKQLGFDLSPSVLMEMQMVDWRDGSQQINDINIGQKSCIEVNEKGTEAAAVMYSFSGGGGGSPPPSLSFIADHPFLFALKEDSSDTVFFVGSVFNPQPK